MNIRAPAPGKRAFYRVGPLSHVWCPFASLATASQEGMHCCSSLCSYFFYPSVDFFFVFFFLNILFRLLKKYLCNEVSPYKYFIEWFKLEFHGLEKWWNTSFKKLELFQIWQDRVPKYRMLVRNALRPRAVHGAGDEKEHWRAAMSL